MAQNSPDKSGGRWHHGVTRYQWLVLAIASAGWIFDAFEGQLFNITRGDMLPELLGKNADPALAKMWGERFLGIFLIGGTLGGWLFSSLADKWGRKPVMVLTILCYSIFSGATAFATELWHVGVLRFIVAMGVGGEWAVGAALVTEVFPARVRASACGIFHSSSIVAFWLAAGTGLFVGANWRAAYLIGLIPAPLVFCVRYFVHEPEPWKLAREAKTEQLGSYRALLGDARWRSRAIFGALLAMVGLATLWGVFIAGQDLAGNLLKHLPNAMADADAKSNAKIAYGYIQTAGAGLGMLSFGPLSMKLGRRRTFALMHVCAFAITPVVCWLPSYFQSYALLLCLLPVFGFFTLGIHAGYAVYFPELFPSYLRATGAGFCFNTGRIMAAPVLFWLSAWMKSVFDLRLAISFLGGFFLLGLVFLCFLPETKDETLP